MAIVTPSLTYYPDPTKGRPIHDGSLYVGVPDLDPAVPANQKQITLRLEDGSSVLASQPVSIGKGGVILYNGSYAVAEVDGDYSVKILDRRGDTAYYIPNNSGVFDATQVGIEINGLGRDSVQSYLQNKTVYDYAELIANLAAGYYNPGDAVTVASTSTPGINGQFTVFAAVGSEYTTNNGTIFTANGGTSLMGMLVAVRNYSGEIEAIWFGAVADGTNFGGTDNAAAINAATLAGKPLRQNVILPAGRFRIDSPIYVYNGQMLKGAGMAATKIEPHADIDGIVFSIDEQGGAIGRAGCEDIFVNYTTNGSLTFTSGSGFRLLCSSTIPQKVWKTSFRNCQVYQPGYAGWNLEGSSAAAVAETYLSNCEVGKGQFGYIENSDVFDTTAIQLYVETCTDAGIEVRGGSHTFFHPHAVNCGTESGGVISGGGYNIRTNYVTIVDGHADRNLGHGFIVGGFSGEDARVGIRLIGCRSFNNGATSSTEGSMYHIGAVKHLKITDSWAGRIGSSFAANNTDGFVFNSTDVENAKLVACTVRDVTGIAYDIPSGTPQDEVSLIGCSHEEDLTAPTTIISRPLLCQIQAGNLGYNYQSGSVRLGVSTEVAIVSGVAAVPLGAAVLDLTAEGGATDDVDTLSGGVLNQEIWVRRRIGEPTITLKTGTGNIVSASGSDIVLNSNNFSVKLLFNGSNWTNSQ